MTIGEKLNESNAALSSLLTYANGVTGHNDTNVGDAIKKLCDGFGTGGISVDISYYTPAEDETVEYAINNMHIPVSANRNTFVLIGSSRTFKDMDSEPMPIKQSVCCLAAIFTIYNESNVIGVKAASNNYNILSSSYSLTGRVRKTDGFFTSSISNSGASTMYANSYFPAGIKLRIMHFKF